VKDTFVDVAVFLGNRRSRKNKIKFINYFRNIYNNKKIKTDIIYLKQKINESFHFVVGDLKRAKKVVITPLDTGSKMLLPFYKYHPTDSKSNFASEILNTTIYIVLSLFMVLILLLINRNYNSYKLAIKVLLIVLDFILAIIAFGLIKNHDNKNNYNRNSQSIALMIENSYKSYIDVAYIFVDQTAMMNLGYQQVQKYLKNREVLLLDCLGVGSEKLFLVTSEANSNMVNNYKDILTDEVILLNKEETENSPLKYFEKGMMLTSGAINKNRIEVSDTRTIKDQQIDFDRLNFLNEKLLKYINYKI